MTSNQPDLDALWQQLVPDPSVRAYANENLRMLVLSTGTLKDGREYYAYVALSPANYIEMLKAEQAGNGFELTDFGEILQWGEGKEPPEEVKTFMTETYGADPNFATDITDLIKKAAEQGA